MAIQVLEKTVLSSDKIHTLHGKVYLPEGKPKGLFHVVHGMVEYIGRYDTFMREIAEDGWIVFGYDNLGHGNTAINKDELGFIAHKDGWKILADDVAVFKNAISEEYGKDLPYILMGHSMGSFIVRLTAVRHDIQDKLIIMGTGGPNPASGAGMAMINIIKSIYGEKHISPLIEKLAFGSYNSHFTGENDPVSWLTKNTEIRNSYKNDPFCSYKFKVSAMGDLIKLNTTVNKKSWAENMNKNKPVLLVSGSDDPVGDYGKGVQKVYEMLKNNNVPTQIHIYENCRHEILNDNCHNEVVNDIKNFINQ